MAVLFGFVAPFQELFLPKFGHVIDVLEGEVGINQSLAHFAGDTFDPLEFFLEG